jgi:hypothetical protein
MTKCFLCDVENNDKLTRSLIPRELLDKDDAGNIIVTEYPVCLKCNRFMKVVESNFIQLCTDARLFEWYRANSTSRGVYFPPTFVYNVDIHRLRELYMKIFEMCVEADKTASNDDLRQQRRDDFNYTWRKKDV